MSTLQCENNQVSLTLKRILLKWSDHLVKRADINTLDEFLCQVAFLLPQISLLSHGRLLVLTHRPFTALQLNNERAQ